MWGLFFSRAIMSRKSKLKMLSGKYENSELIHFLCAWIRRADGFSAFGTVLRAFRQWLMLVKSGTKNKSKDLSFLVPSELFSAQSYVR